MTGLSINPRLAAIIAGDKPHKFVVTETDGTINPSSKWVFQEVKRSATDGRTTDPTEDFKFTLRSSVKGKDNSSAQDMMQVPDVVFCNHELHDDLKQLYGKYASEIYDNNRAPALYDLADPVDAANKLHPSWRNGIYWSSGNRPVWRHKKLPFVFSWNSTCCFQPKFGSFVLNESVCSGAELACFSRRLFTLDQRYMARAE